MLPLNVDMKPAAHKAQSNQSFRTTGSPVNLGETERYPVMWRPWVLRHREAGKRQEKSEADGMESFNTQMPKGALGFQHPVRLCMPKSRTQEYLSHLGQKVLASFPIQATLHFYNDDSSSEEEEEGEKEAEECDMGETRLPAVHVEKTFQVCSCSAERLRDSCDLCSVFSF
ncbi:protein ripply3 [Anguilla anguilla]|uniref:protein ripply3 n=1 Tax=Anguilla anguilla TaxID=7936 RepID=UPI0015A91620|nr:protein ripply3 [Anguilla anguilla]